MRAESDFCQVSPDNATVPYPDRSPCTVPARLDFKQTALNRDKQLVRIALIDFPSAAEVRIG